MLTASDEVLIEKATTAAVKRFEREKARAERPELRAHEVRDGASVIQVTTSGAGDAAPVQRMWAGYGITLMRPLVFLPEFAYIDPNPIRIAASIWFRTPGEAAMPNVLLLQGDAVRVHRGFSELWVQITAEGIQAGQTVDVPFALWKDPMIEPVITPRVRVESDTRFPLNTGGNIARAVRGTVTAPAIGASIIDTGQLIAGDYEFHTTFATTDTTGNDVYLVRRNAADGADVAGYLWMATANHAAGMQNVVVPRIRINTNERVRWRNGGVAGTAGKIYHGTIAYRRVA